MNCEAFRSEFLMRMQDSGIDQGMIDKVLPVFDVISSKYDISSKPTDLSVVSGVPEAVKIYIASKAVENLSKGSLKQYNFALTKFFKTIQKPFNTVTTNDVRVYLFGVKERNVKDSYIEGIRIIINGFYEWLVQEGYMDKNPVRRIAHVKFNSSQRKPLTEIELEQMRASCKTPRQKALIDFLFSTGCRLAELTDLEINDVDFAQNEVYIRHGKGDKPRTTYLNARSIISLKAYLATRSDDSPFLFVTNRKPCHKMSKRAVEVEINKITELSGLNRTVSPHVFRHTAATTALRHGMNIEEVQRFLGHTNIDTTMIYAKVDNSAVKASHMRCVS